MQKPKTTKRAILIGINYFDTDSELRGCHNDVDSMEKILIHKFGYLAENIHIMKDEKNDPKFMNTNCPTREGILSAMNTLVQQSQAGDTAFIHYSGHGTWTYDNGSDEADRRDELLCPVDGYIRDDDLRNILVAKLREGVKLRCIFDCCHSASMLDLPFRWRFTWKSYEENKKVTMGDAIMISGCRDDQTSADAWVNSNGKNRFAGALTWAFCECIEDAYHLKKVTLTWKEILFNVRFRLLKEGYSQVPQASFVSRRELRKKIDI